MSRRSCLNRKVKSMRGGGFLKRLLLSSLRRCRIWSKKIISDALHAGSVSICHSEDLSPAHAWLNQSIIQWKLGFFRKILRPWRLPTPCSVEWKKKIECAGGFECMLRWPRYLNRWKKGACLPDCVDFVRSRPFSGGCIGLNRSIIRCEVGFSKHFSVGRVCQPFAVLNGNKRCLLGAGLIENRNKNKCVACSAGRIWLNRKQRKNSCQRVLEIGRSSSSNLESLSAAQSSSPLRNICVGARLS